MQMSHEFVQIKAALDEQMSEMGNKVRQTIPYIIYHQAIIIVIYK